MSVELSHLSRRASSPPVELPIRSADEEESFPDGGVLAYSVVLGLFMGTIVNLGIINSIGAIQVYVSTHQLINVSTLNISWIFSIYLCLAYAFSIITGNIFDRKGPTGLLVGSTIFIFVGLMGAASSTSIWHFVLSFISLGIGNGLGMAPLISVISHWFLTKRANCTGIATSGGSVGGLIFPLMLRTTFVRYGYVWAMRILAFTCLGFMLVSVALVRGRFRRPKKESTGFRFSSIGLHILKKPMYVFIILGAFFAELSLVLLLTYFASYAISQGGSESDSYLLLTVWNATGILGRWIPGYLADIYGSYNLNIIMLVTYNLCIFVIWLPFGMHIKALFAFAGFGGFALGSILSLLPACLAQVTPVDEVGTNYGILNACLSIANLFGIPIASAIIGHGTVKEYNHYVVFLGLLSVSGTVFWYLARWTLVGLRLNVKV